MSGALLRLYRQNKKAPGLFRGPFIVSSDLERSNYLAKAERDGGDAANDDQQDAPRLEVQRLTLQRQFVAFLLGHRAISGCPNIGAEDLGDSQVRSPTRPRDDSRQTQAPPLS